MKLKRLIFLIVCLGLGAWVLMVPIAALQGMYPSHAAKITLFRLVIGSGLIALLYKRIINEVIMLLNPLTQDSTFEMRHSVSTITDTSSDNLKYSLKWRLPLAACSGIAYVIIVLTMIVQATNKNLGFVVLLTFFSILFPLVILKILRWSIEINDDHLVYRDLVTRTERFASIKALEFRDVYTAYIVFWTGSAIQLGTGTPQAEILAALSIKTGLPVTRRYK